MEQNKFHLTLLHKISNMNYEFHDYRPKKPEPDIGGWPFWILPVNEANGYIIRMVLILIVLPLLFLGYLLTPTTTFLYWIIFDLIEYIKIKNKKGFLP